MSPTRRPVGGALGLSAKATRTLGVTALIVGSWLLHEGFEGAGKGRPWALKLLPGV